MNTQDTIATPTFPLLMLAAMLGGALYLALSGCSAVPLTRVNQTLEGGYQVAHLVDTLQTLHGPASDRCYQENDMATRGMIGRLPSKTGVVAWGLGEAAVHYGVYRLLADNGHNYLASAWEAVTVTATVSAVASNYQLGIRVGAKNLDKGCTH